MQRHQWQGSSSANHFNFLMRDGQTCTISLKRSFRQGTVQLYELEVRIGEALHLLALRYSALRSLSKLLPNCAVKFPEPEHLASFISQLTGNQGFLQRRERELRRYFEEISRTCPMELAKSVEALLGKAETDTPLEDLNSNPPPAPRITGKKLSKKNVAAEFC